MSKGANVFLGKLTTKKILRKIAKLSDKNCVHRNIIHHLKKKLKQIS